MLHDKNKHVLMHTANCKDVGWENLTQQVAIVVKVNEGHEEKYNILKLKLITPSRKITSLANCLRDVISWQTVHRVCSSQA